MIETEETTTRAESRRCEILAFCCNFCAYAAADLAGARRMQYPANVRIVHVPCTGKVGVQQILAALERGVDGGAVAGCWGGDAGRGPATSSRGTCGREGAWRRRSRSSMR